MARKTYVLPSYHSIVEPCRLSLVQRTINNNRLNSTTFLCSRVHGDRPHPPLGFQLFLDPPHGRRPPVVAADPGCRRTTVDEDSCVAAPEPWVPAISLPNDLRNTECSAQDQIANFFRSYPERFDR